MQRFTTRRRWLLLASLLLAVISTARARAREPVEVVVVVRSTRSTPDAVSFVYSTSARDAQARKALETQARQDFARLAAALGQPGAAVKVTTASEPAQAPPTTSAEGKLAHLVKRSAGWLNIGPLLKVFSRYDRLSLTYFVEPPFQFQGPRGPFENAQVALTVDEGGMVFTYHVRIKEHPAGAVGAVLPDFAAPAGPGRLAYVLIGLIAVTAGVAVYTLLQYWVQRKQVKG
jgi:hypothetical protein